MREDELLRHIYGRSAALSQRFAAVLVGPGDDCAVVATARGDALLLTVDQVVEGRHFVLDERFAHGRVGAHRSEGIEPAGAEGATLEQVAHKAIARSVSDIAAMGGQPAWGLATGLLPQGWPHADALFDAMAVAAAALGCPLVGGDIAMWGSDGSADDVRGAIVLTVTIGGAPHEARGPVLRSGARAGDAVYITGAVGGSLASGRHLSFSPRVMEAAWLCDVLGERLHAMIDVSDGVGIDASRLGAASGVVLELDAAALPLQAGVVAWRSAASEGEDYELLFTVAGDAEFPAACPLTGTPVTRLGVVRAGGDGGGGARLRAPDGAVLDGSGLGWDHGGNGAGA